MRTIPLVLAALAALAGPGCGDDDAGGRDGGTVGDGSTADAGGRDAGPRDGGTDAGPVLPDCDPGCTTDCPQSCYDLGDCTATGGELDLIGNVHTLGVVLTLSGADESAQLYYRAEGETTWWRGPAAALLPDGRVGSSAFGLAPDTGYEVMVRAGSDTACGTVRTEPVDPPHTSEAELFVDEGASPGGDGSEGAPFATIQAAVDAAGPGTDVHVAAGVYHESLHLSSGGAEGRFLRILGEDGAVLDGSAADPSLDWTADGTNVWRADWSGDPRYLVRDDARMYHYLSLADLRSGTGDDGVPIDEGFFVESGALYVRSLDDPSGHVWHVPVHNDGIFLEGASWVWVEGMEIRYYGDGEYGTGIDVRAADHAVIRGNRIHEVPSPVTIRRGSRFARVQDNEIHQSSIYDWPWDAVKGTDHENSAIGASGGRGAIVSGNRIHDIFNGVYTGSFGEATDTSISFDVDVYDNVLARIGDDGLEPEGACINNRFHDNAVDGVHNGVSLAPITYGPVWVVRNRFTDYEESGFKVSNDSSGRVWLLHNTCFTDRAETNGMGVSGYFENMVFRNNLVRGTRYALEMTIDAGDNDLDYDLWYTPRGAPEIKWTDTRYDDVPAWCAATGLECHAPTGEPMLVDPAGGRFAPADGSPALDAGEHLWGIDDFFEGDAPDVGYRELGAPEPSRLP